jgi:RNA polymerase sigma-70 factor, ECF subfamily
VTRFRNRSEADRERFERVYRQTRMAILAYLVRRTESAEDAADMLAEVYLIAWRKLDDLPSGEQARLWLFGVARRVLANQRRRYRSQDRLAATLEQTLQLHRRDEQWAAREEGLSDTGIAALNTLSVSDRELVMLSAWEELSPAEIAVVLSRPAALIRVRLHRARAKLRARLVDPDSDPDTLLYEGRVIDAAATATE